MALVNWVETLGRHVSAPRASGDAGVRNYVVGVEMTQWARLGALESNGLKTVTPAMGDRFDPHLHQAMMEQDSPDLAPGGVIQCLQPGYELLGRLVRPAMVVVASRTSGGATPEGEAPGAHLDTRA